MGMGTVRMSDEGWTYSLCTRQQERLVRGTQVKETSKSTEVLFCTPEIDYPGDNRLHTGYHSIL